MAQSGDRSVVHARWDRLPRHVLYPVSVELILPNLLFLP